ncbi:hypothetical protein GQ457_17G014290 [Hibiscus cannabinus]
MGTSAAVHLSTPVASAPINGTKNGHHIHFSHRRRINVARCVSPSLISAQRTRKRGSFPILSLSRLHRSDGFSSVLSFDWRDDRDPKTGLNPVALTVRLTVVDRRIVPILRYIVPRCPGYLLTVRIRQMPLRSPPFEEPEMDFGHCLVVLSSGESCGTMAAGNTDVARFRVPDGVCQHHTRFNIGPWGLALHVRDNYRVWNDVWAAIGFFDVKLGFGCIYVIGL